MRKQDADRVELLLSPAVCAGLSAAPETRRLAFACVYFLLFLLTLFSVTEQTK